MLEEMDEEFGIGGLVEEEFGVKKVGHCSHFCVVDFVIIEHAENCFRQMNKLQQYFSCVIAAKVFCQRPARPQCSARTRFLQRGENSHPDSER